MARIYLNLVYTVFEPLTRVCNISMHTSIHEKPIATFSETLRACCFQKQRYSHCIKIQACRQSKSSNLPLAPLLIFKRCCDFFSFSLGLTSSTILFIVFLLLDSVTLFTSLGCDFFLFLSHLYHGTDFISFLRTPLSFPLLYIIIFLFMPSFIILLFYSLTFSHIKPCP